MRNQSLRDRVECVLQANVLEMDDFSNVFQTFSGDLDRQNGTVL